MSKKSKQWLQLPLFCPDVTVIKHKNTHGRNTASICSILCWNAQMFLSSFLWSLVRIYNLCPLFYWCLCCSKSKQITAAWSNRSQLIPAQFFVFFFCFLNFALWFFTGSDTLQQGTFRNCCRIMKQQKKGCLAPFCSDLKIKSLE